MGKGKRIQDFRNLNLDSCESKKDNKIKSSIKENEFIIEVEEKPRKSKTDIEDNPIIMKDNSIKKKKNKFKNKKKLKKQKSPKTYIEKEAEKKRKEKRKNTSIFVSSFILFFVLIGVIAGCLTTPTFNVTTIIAEDGINVSAAEVKKYFSDIKEKNTFLINIKEVEEKIESHPYIYKAEISRKLPNGLQVNYKERKPYAIVKYIESYVLIDKFGSILEIKKENEQPNLPIIYGIEAEEFVPGQKLREIAKIKFDNSVYLLETAEHIDFKYTISEINYTDADKMRVLIDEVDVEIIYGTVETEILNDKMTYLNEVLNKLEDKKGTLDISSENYSEKIIFAEILK